MSNEIFETFYYRMMPLFKPQAEQILTISAPEDFRKVAFRYTFSVEAMTKISHIIEDMVIRTPAVADLHVSFQYLSRLLPQRDRYRRVAQAARKLWLYGTYDTPAATMNFLPRAAIIDTSGTTLMQYWFVVAYGPGVGMSLVAEEIPAMTGAERFYEGFYTFELDVAYQLNLILHQIYPDQVRRPIPPEQLENS